MMYPNASLEQRKDINYLGEVSVVCREIFDGILKYIRNKFLLVCGIELEFRQGKRKSLAFSLAKGENNDGVVVLKHDHFDDFGDIRLR